MIELTTTESGIFPNKDIPKPEVKHYFWNQGVCYWKPPYNSQKYIKSVSHP